MDELEQNMMQNETQSNAAQVDAGGVDQVRENELPPDGGQSAKKAKLPFSRLGFAMLAFVLVQQLVASIVYGVAAALAPNVLQSGWFMWVAAYLPLYLVAFPVFLRIVKGVKNHAGGPAQPTKMTVVSLLLLVLASIGIVFFINLIIVGLSAAMEALSGEGVTNTAGELMLGSNPWVNLFFASIVAPVMEEITFRQIFYKKLILFGGKTYVVFSALLFALMHPNVYQIFYAFVLGLLLAGVRYFTGTLTYCIFIHMVINFLFGGGVTPFLLAYIGENAAAIWSIVLMVMGVAGLIIGAVWFAKKRSALQFAPAQQALQNKKAMVLNPGFILYALSTLALILFTQFTWIFGM